MEFDNFVDLLYNAGWQATHDAQHSHIQAVWELLFPVIAKLEKENKEVLDNIVKLQDENIRLQNDISEYAEAQPPI